MLYPTVDICQLKDKVMLVTVLFYWPHLLLRELYNTKSVVSSMVFLML